MSCFGSQGIKGLWGKGSRQEDCPNNIGVNVGVKPTLYTADGCLKCFDLWQAVVQEANMLNPKYSYFWD